MNARDLRLAVVVLAAGAGQRFSAQPGAKLLAPIEGEPLLARVLRQVRAFPAATTVVVLGHGADAVEAGLSWSDEIRVRNHEPERGLSSSLQVGIDALRALPDPFDGAFIVLGDQPRLRADVMRALAVAAVAGPPADRPVVVPRYEEAGPRNPVLLLRPAWAWVDDLTGDSGLGTLITKAPDSVLEVAVHGTMPDVDTPDDLARLDQGENR
jgi:molybdenum cofactor cytidylyltransferase